MLDELVDKLLYVPITTSIMRRAAQLWAEVRWKGWTTADKKELDGDVILGAQWESEQVKASQVIVATTNISHLRLVSDAHEWRSIT
jgi:hypothetical protein